MSRTVGASALVADKIYLDMTSDVEVAAAEARAEAARLTQEVAALRLELEQLKGQADSLRKSLPAPTPPAATQLPSKAAKPPQAAALAIKQAAEQRGKPRELRRYPRYRTRLDSCRVLDRNFTLLTECLLRDISETGCRISLFDKKELPNELLMLRERDGVLINAVVKWREAGEYGLHFRNSLTRTDPAYPHKQISALNQSRTDVGARRR